MASRYRRDSSQTASRSPPPSSGAQDDVERGRSRSPRNIQASDTPAVAVPVQQPPQIQYIPPASLYTSRTPSRSRSRSPTKPKRRRQRTSSVNRPHGPSSSNIRNPYTAGSMIGPSPMSYYTAHEPYESFPYTQYSMRSDYTGYPPAGPPVQPPVTFASPGWSAPHSQPIYVTSNQQPIYVSPNQQPIYVSPNQQAPYPSSHVAHPYTPSFSSYVPDNRSYTSQGGNTIYHDAEEVQYTSVNPWSAPQHTPSKLPLVQNYQASPSTYVIYPYKSRTSIFGTLIAEFFGISAKFFVSVLPNQIYLNFLLRLPSFYFTRVARIFEEANMSMEEIKTMAQASARKGDSAFDQWYFSMGDLVPNLKTSWESFIDSLLREWKTLNIISVLLLSAILTILQIDSAANDPITRYFSLFSLICTLISLLFGCIYIIRFSTMRKPHKAAEWAAEAQNQEPNIWWNVWVLLAMPAAWLAWSIVLYIACIMSFVWRTGPGSDPNPGISSTTQLGLRVGVSATLGLGLVYFVLIVREFRRYGDVMDQSFKRKIDAWARERKASSIRHHYPPPPSYERNPTIYSAGGGTSPTLRPSTPRFEQTPVIPPMNLVPSPTLPELGPDAPVVTFKPLKIMDLRFQDTQGNTMPIYLTSRTFTEAHWNEFVKLASDAWNRDPSTPRTKSLFQFGTSTPYRPQDRVVETIQMWNTTYFRPRQTLAFLCLEYLVDYPLSPLYAIYLVDTRSNPADHPGAIASQFDELPEGLSRIDIFDQPEVGGQRRRMLGRTVITAPLEPTTTRVHFSQSTENNGNRGRSRSRTRSPPPPSSTRLHRNGRQGTLLSEYSAREPDSPSIVRRHSDAELDTRQSQLEESIQPHTSSSPVLPPPLPYSTDLIRNSDDEGSPTGEPNPVVVAAPIDWPVDSAVDPMSGPQNRQRSRSSTPHRRSPSPYYSRPKREPMRTSRPTTRKFSTTSPWAASASSSRPVIVSSQPHVPPWSSSYGDVQQPHVPPWSSSYGDVQPVRAHRWSPPPSERPIYPVLPTTAHSRSRHRRRSRSPRIPMFYPPAPSIVTPPFLQPSVPVIPSRDRRRYPRGHVDNSNPGYGYYHDNQAGRWTTPYS